MAESTMEYMRANLTAIVYRSGKYFVAQGVEIELASQGRTQKKALDNLQEAFNLWLAYASPSEKKKLQAKSKVASLAAMA